MAKEIHKHKEKSDSSLFLDRFEVGVSLARFSGDHGAPSGVCPPRAKELVGKDLFFALMALNGDRDVALRFLVTESIAFSGCRLQFGSANNKV